MRHSLNTTIAENPDGLVITSGPLFDFLFQQTYRLATTYIIAMILKR